MKFLSTLLDKLIDATIEGIKKGDIWLNKIRYDAQGNRILGNVCLEVYLPSRGTCLLQHINLGACSIEDLVPAFTEGMSSLVALHAQTGVGDTGEYLPSETDRQVGLGVLGLADFLCQNERWCIKSLETPLPNSTLINRSILRHTSLYLNLQKPLRSCSTDRPSQ